MRRVCYSCPILSKVESGRQCLLKIPNIKFYLQFVQHDPSSSMQTDRQTTRLEEINSRFFKLFLESTKMSGFPANKPRLVSDGACRPTPCCLWIAAELRRTYVRSAHVKRETKLLLQSEWPCPVSDKTETQGQRRSLSSDGVICWHKQIFIVIMIFFPFLLLKLNWSWRHIRSANCRVLWFSEFVLITQWAKDN